MPPGPNGYDSPTSFSACVAFAVKMTWYSAGDALKNRRTRPRARSNSSVAQADAGLFECGFPST